MTSSVPIAAAAGGAQEVRVEKNEQRATLLILFQTASAYAVPVARNVYRGCSHWATADAAAEDQLAVAAARGPASVDIGAGSAQRMQSMLWRQQEHIALCDTIV